jgi:hypothetical protein
MLAIDKLSRTEKLRMMEALWRDLAADVGDFSSPPWHAQALREAETAAADGSARMMDWADAKNLLRRRARP